MRIFLTGMAGRLGRLAAAHLVARGHEVVGIDARPMAQLPAGASHHRTSLQDRSVTALFEQRPPQAVVHLGVVHNFRHSPEHMAAENVHATEKLLRLVMAHNVNTLVLLSSGDVYGPSPTNSHFLTEDTPLRASERFPAVRTLVAVDRAVSAFMCRFPHVQTVLLRPAHIVGPNVRNAASNYLRLRRIPTQMGFDPMLQLTCERDVCRALAASLDARVRGAFNLASTGPVPLSKVLLRLNKTVLPIPHILFGGALKQLWKLGFTSFPPPELDHIRFNTVLDTSRAEAALGIAPTADLSALLAPFVQAPAPERPAARRS